MQRSIRFPDDLDARIAAKAAADDRSFSYVVLRTLESALGPPKIDVAEAAVIARECRGADVASARAPGRCPDCGKANGVHKGDCPQHPRNV